MKLTNSSKNKLNSKTSWQNKPTYFTINLFLLLIMNLIVFFGVIHESYCMISTKFYYFKFQQNKRIPNKSLTCPQRYSQLIDQMMAIFLWDVMILTLWVSALSVAVRESCLLRDPQLIFWYVNLKLPKQPSFLLNEAIIPMLNFLFLFLFWLDE